MGESTPPRRRKSTTYNSPGLNTSNAVLLTENDDAKEKRARRRSHHLVNNILSPGGLQSSPGRQALPGNREKRKSVSLSHAGMSNDQLKAHYASCIKLSSENKINVKNAFALHLIDYMKELLKESQSVDSGTNFQLASCTLDAGVKIYSYRVDSVHRDTYKVLGSLGRAIDNQDDDEDGEEGSQGSQRVKKAKKASGKTLEKNLRNINCEEFDLDFEVDPYFHKTSSAFDEGGTAGLLSLQVRTKSDGNHLMLDSATKLDDIISSKDAGTDIPQDAAGDAEGETNPYKTDEEMADLNFFRSAYTKSSIENLELCPLLIKFSFSGWDKNAKGGNIGLPEDSFDDNIHRFDENAPVIPDDADNLDRDSIDCPGYDDFSDAGHDDGDIGPVEFDGRAAQFSNRLSSSARSIMDLTGASTMPLQVFPLELSEYSYFNQDLLSMWKGPLHWKIGPRSKDQLTSLLPDGSEKKPKMKKEAFRIDFDDDDTNVIRFLSSGRAETYLKEVTLKKYSAQMTTLPLELAYEVKNLFNMFLNEKFVMIRREAQKLKLDDKEDVLYDYDNKNDTQAFCPAIDDGGNNYDDDDDYDAGGLPDTTFGVDTQQPVMQEQAFGEASLVAPPTKVRILDINYAKSAKRIDIKKLKATMWNMLTFNPDNEKENIEQNTLPRPVIDGREVGEEKDESTVSGLLTFKSLYRDLPSKLSTNMANNLSGPISFVCLLYLANEKNLTLTNTDDMDDIFIASNPQ